MIKRETISRFLALALVLTLALGLMPQPARAATEADVVAVAESLVGQYPYITGGKDPGDGGFDCSGLVYYVYHTCLGHEMTIYQARNRYGLLSLGEKITDRSQFKAGDVVQFTYDHVAIYVGDNMIVEASKPGTLIRKVSLQYRPDVAYAVRLNLSGEHVHVVHTWDQGVVTSEATLTSPGAVLYTCTECGATRTESVRPWSSVSASCGGDVSLLLTQDGLLRLQGSGQAAVPVKDASDDSFRMGDYVDFVTAITVEEGITSLEGGALEGFSRAGTLTLPSSLKSIGGAFTGCTALESVSIPAGVSQIDPAAFLDCENLRAVEVDAGNSSYASQNGVVFSKSMQKLVLCPEGKAYGYAVPEGVTEIGDRAFENCGSLSSLSLPQSVTSIGRDCFKGFGGTLQVHCSSYAAQYAQAQGVSYNIDRHDWDWEHSEVTKPATTTTTGILTVTCTSCGETQEMEIPVYEPGFTDVEKDAYYYEAVAWAVQKGIAQGTGGTSFGPDEQCTRAQAVTMLWRAMGSPEPSGPDNPFADISQEDYFYKAVLWAVENGVITGTGENTFSPDEVCRRGMIVTILWRAAGKPPASAPASFVDVPPGEYYSDAVSWAVQQGVTNGTGEDSFSPDQNCVRAQIVTFLYRAFGA